MCKRIISAVVAIGFIATQCGLGFAAQNLRQGQIVGDGAKSAAIGEMEIAMSSRAVSGFKTIESDTDLLVAGEILDVKTRIIYMIRDIDTEGRIITYIRSGLVLTDKTREEIKDKPSLVREHWCYRPPVFKPTDILGESRQPILITAGVLLKPGDIIRHFGDIIYKLPIISIVEGVEGHIIGLRTCKLSDLGEADKGIHTIINGQKLYHGKYYLVGSVASAAGSGEIEKRRSIAQLLNEARWQMKHGTVAAAKAVLVKAIDKYPDEPNFYLALRSIENPQEAIQLAQELIRRNPKNFFAREIFLSLQREYRATQAEAEIVREALPYGPAEPKFGTGPGQIPLPSGLGVAKADEVVRVPLVEGEQPGYEGIDEPFSEEPAQAAGAAAATAKSTGIGLPQGFTIYRPTLPILLGSELTEPNFLGYRKVLEANRNMLGNVTGWIYELPKHIRVMLEERITGNIALVIGPDAENIGTVLDERGPFGYRFAKIITAFDETEALKKLQDEIRPIALIINNTGRPLALKLTDGILVVDVKEPAKARDIAEDALLEAV